MDSTDSSTGEDEDEDSDDEDSDAHGPEASTAGRGPPTSTTQDRMDDDEESLPLEGALGPAAALDAPAAPDAPDALMRLML